MNEHVDLLASEENRARGLLAMTTFLKKNETLQVPLNRGHHMWRTPFSEKNTIVEDSDIPLGPFLEESRFFF